MSPVCRKAKVVLLYAETKSVVATQRRFRAHFGTKWAPCKQTSYKLSLGTIFEPIRINSVPDFKCFVSIKMCYVYNQLYDISYVTLHNIYFFCNCVWTLFPFLRPTHPSVLTLLCSDSGTVEIHLSGLIRTARYPDVQKIRIIGFFFENRLHWQFEVEKIYKLLF